MTEREFTDEEIIKALECCVGDDFDYCKECPSLRNKPCQEPMLIGALDLINRQKAEIKKVKSCLEFYLDNNEENGVVFIPKFVVENRIKEMTEGENELD